MSTNCDLKPIKTINILYLKENVYLCVVNMENLETQTYNYKCNDYVVAMIPDVFTNRKNGLLKIGPQSLNSALYDEELGYDSDRAKSIDEQIYAYVDDNLFNHIFN